MQGSCNFLMKLPQEGFIESKSCALSQALCWQSYLYVYTHVLLLQRFVLFFPILTANWILQEQNVWGQMNVSGKVVMQPINRAVLFLCLLLPLLCAGRGGRGGGGRGGGRGGSRGGFFSWGRSGGGGGYRARPTTPPRPFGPVKSNYISSIGENTETFDQLYLSWLDWM